MFIECCLCYCSPSFNVTCTSCVICYHATHAVEIFHLIHFVFGLSPSLLGSVALRCQLLHFFDTHFFTKVFPTSVSLCAVVCVPRSRRIHHLQTVCGVELSDGGKSSSGKNAEANACGLLRFIITALSGGTV